MGGKDEEYKVKSVMNGEELVPDKMYDVCLDLNTFLYNDELKAYAAEHAECVPPKDNGRHIIEVVVEYLCKKLWLRLCDANADGGVSEAEAEAFFRKADKDGSGTVDKAELKAMLAAELGSGASELVAEQMIALFDDGGDKALSMREMQKSAEAL